MPLPEPLAYLCAGGAALRRSDLVTLSLTFFVIGVTVAALAVTAGTAPLTAFVAAGILYAATAELAFLAVVAGGGSTVTGVLSGWLVASRFGLLAVTLSQLLGPGLSRWKRAAAAFVAVDPSVAIAAVESTQSDRRRTYVVLSFWMTLGWLVGSAFGALLAERIGDPGAIGLDAVFPAALVAIMAPALRRREAQVAGLVSLLVTLALVEVTPGGVPVLLSLVGAVVAVLAVRPEVESPSP